MRLRSDLLLTLLLGAVPSLRASILYNVTALGTLPGYDFNSLF